METITHPVILEAIQSGDLVLVKELLAKKPALAHTRNAQGTSAILIALYFNQPEIARYLAIKVETLDIFESAALGDLKRVKKWIAQDSKLANAVNLDGFQPLGLAVYFGQKETAIYLMKHGAQVNGISQNNLRAAPLHSALATRNTFLVKEILKHGGDVNLPESGGYTPLHIAAQNGDVDALEILLAYHPDLDPRLEADGLTPLGTAVKYGNEQAAEFLRQHGCLE